MKMMGIDLGQARTGVCVSDLSGFLAGRSITIPEHIAQPLEVYRRVGYGPDSRYVAALCQRMDCESVLLGLPLNMNGTEGPKAAECRAFAAQLQEVCGLEVVLWDERRTTVEAHQILSDCNYHGKKRKNTVDAVAASLILEGYLAFLSRC